MKKIKKTQKMSKLKPTEKIIQSMLYESISHGPTVDMIMAQVKVYAGQVAKERCNVTLESHRLNYDNVVKKHNRLVSKYNELREVSKQQLLNMTDAVSNISNVLNAIRPAENDSTIGDTLSENSLNNTNK